MAEVITLLRSQYDARVAEAREAGAAEVRARIEAWWADFFGCRLDSCNCRDARDLRSYLNGGESDV